MHNHTLSSPSEATAEAACSMEMSSDNREGKANTFGIFYWDQDCDIKWHMDKLIDKMVIKYSFKGGHLIPLSVLKEEWKNEAMKHAFIMLYYCHQSNKSVEGMSNYLQFFLDNHGSENIIVVISGHKDTESTEGTLARWPANIQTVIFTEIQMEIISLCQTTTPERRMGYKLNDMRNIMTPIKGSQKHIVGICTEDKDKSLWLQKLLKSYSFEDQVKDVRDIIIPYHSKNAISMQSISFLIIYCTNISLDKELDFLHVLQNKDQSKDKIPAVIVLDELEDSNDEGRLQILQRQPQIRQLAKELFLFSKKEKESNYPIYLTALYKVHEKIEANWKMLEDFIRIKGAQNKTNTREDQSTPPSTDSPQNSKKEERKKDLDAIQRDSLGQSKNTTIIFSRSGSDNYTWLTELLGSEHFTSCVKDVRSFYISNNNRQEFMEKVQQCTFGILYHTKRRGRVNITNVTDSLYDWELEYMSRCLKKENIIVVIDDMDDISDKEKERILSHQPSIKTYAQNLILTDEYKKKDTFLAEHGMK